MSFNDIKKVGELRAVVEKAAEALGFDVPEGRMTRDEILAFLGEQGVTWQHYKKYVDPDPEPEPTAVTTTDIGVNPDVKVVAADETPPLEIVESPAPVTGPVASNHEQPSEVLLFMQRENFSFRAYGYTWTKAHPFAIVPPEVASNVMDNYEGFRPASPREAQEYYG